MRTALVHYWLVKYRGGERLLELFSDLFPDADLLTLVHRPGAVGEQLERHEIRTSFLQKMPLGVTRYQWYLPLMPWAVESFDMEEYDLVISSESGPAKGVITRPETCHICYSETPMRYIWNMYHSYRRNMSAVSRVLWSVLSDYLRRWDRLTADRVDFFIANSSNVARRIWKYYRRQAVVVHCPVDWESFYIGTDDEYYLFVGELSEYKGIRLAVEAFRGTGRRLLVVGDGPLEAEMKRIAGPEVDFLGWQPREEVAALYANSRALVFPGEEDFGITPLEAMASGKPVLALGRGGALESIIDQETGVFFQEPTIDAVREGIGRIERIGWVPTAIREHAKSFGKEPTRQRLSIAVDSARGLHTESLRNAGRERWATLDDEYRRLTEFNG